MKKVLCIFLAVITTLMLCVSAAAYDKELPVLSELSDEELLAFLQNYDVAIPSGFQEHEQFFPFVRYVIQLVENNSNVSFYFGYLYMCRFAERIKAATLLYYGDTSISTCAGNHTHSLVENTSTYLWNENYGNYNCYAYAIGLTEYYEPGWIKNGITANSPNAEAVVNRTPMDLLTLVCEDLYELNYTNISYSTDPPDDSYITTPHKRVILMRTTNNFGGSYHFMVFENTAGTANDYYHHKPGKSIPLRRNAGISITNPWVEEGCVNNVCSSTGLTYASQIIYIKFTIPCTMSYVNNGTGTHILKCSGCGETSGNTMLCVYVNNRCRLCGGYNPNAMAKGTK